jgi:NitT/TauT family transport system substrate-binding protein
MGATRRYGFRTSALVLATGLILAACGGTDSAEPAPEPAPAPAPATDEAPGLELDRVGPVNIGSIGIPPIYAMLMSLVAEGEGFYDKYAVDVTVRSMETGVDAARAVQSGDLDASFSPTGPVMNFAATGVDVKAIYGYDNIDWLVMSSDMSLASCEDLAGQAVGVDSIGGARSNVLNQILRSCDLTLDDVEQVSFPGAAAVQAVIAGQLETAVVHVDDVYVAREQGVEVNDFIYLIDVNPNAHYLIFWTRTDVLEEKREALVRAMAAHIEAVRFIVDPANQDRVVELARPIGHSDETLRSSLVDFIELEFWPVDRDGLGETKMQAQLNIQVRNADIAEEDAPALESIIDRSLFADALDLGGQMQG